MIEPKELAGMSKDTLKSIYRQFNLWMWPAQFGDPPEGWDTMPNYRRTWMPEDTKTRYDVIKPYMEMILALGVSHFDVYRKK